MIFCDLSVNDSVVWSGVPCLNGVNINTGAYLGFSGGLVFIDTMGSTNPDYLGLVDRYVLLYIPNDGSTNSVVPLEAIPSQQLNIILGNQNCTLSIYDRDETDSVVAGDYVAIIAPSTCSIIATGVASAVGGVSWIWNVTNGAIVAGQGTASITFQPTSGGPVIISVSATLSTGGTAQASATVIAYNPGSFTINAPEYVWAGQFNVPVSTMGGDAPLLWSVSGATKLVGSATQSSTAVDIGMAGAGSSIALAVGGSSVASWTFKVIPYTSPVSHTTVVLAPGAYEDFSLDLGWQYRVLSVATDNPGCLRIYETSSARSADAFRSLENDPNVIAPDPTSIVVEVTTMLGYLSVDLPFQALGTNGDSPRNKTAYCRVYNTGGSSTSITVNISKTETQISNSF